MTTTRYTGTSNRNDTRRNSGIELMLNHWAVNLNKNRDDIIGMDESLWRTKQSQLFLLLAYFCLVGAGAFPQLANASTVLPGEQYNNGVPEQKQLVSSVTKAESPNSLLLANYASEGSGGMPFLSRFNTPGAIPQAAYPNDREAQNRAYDEAFDQDKRDRDAYYAKMALQAREKKAQQLKEQRQALGLDLDDSGPRFGDEPVASMASLKKLLLEKDGTDEN